MNIFGDIHYKLPGLFLHNPYPEVVNAQLWTIPFELLSYIVLAALATLGIFARRRLLLWALVVAQCCFATFIVLRPHGANAPVTGGTLVVCFLAGVLIYRFKDRLAWSASWCTVALVITAILLLIPNGDRLIAFPAAYATVCIGLLNPPRNRLLLSGDYSYGLYLYGFPLQQAFASLAPATRHWYWSLFAVLPVAFSLAALSWWCVERPALRLRPYLTRFEKHYILWKNHSMGTLVSCWQSGRRGFRPD